MLLHPSNGDPNRTWPLERWQELAARLLAKGHQILAIGQRHRETKAGMFTLDGGGEVISLIDEFDSLETVALMNWSDLLVATDSGPIQLAGLTGIGIVGLYSVVAGRNRLPVRNGQRGWRAIGLSPTCRFHPCYERLLASDEYAAHHQGGPKTSEENAKFLGEWCMNEQRFACLSHEITVDKVTEACGSLLAAVATA